MNTGEVLTYFTRYFTFQVKYKVVVMSFTLRE